MIEYGITIDSATVIIAGNGTKARKLAEDIAASSGPNRKVVRRFVSDWEALTEDPTVLEVMAREIWRQTVLAEGDWTEHFDRPPSDEEWMSLNIEEDRERFREAARNVLSMITGKF